MKKKHKNYGFKKPKVVRKGKKAHYFLGALGGEMLQPDRNWLPFIPDFEPQSKQFETFNCTGFNTEHAVRTLMKRLGIDENYSARWIGIIAGTHAPGNDPHTVAEAIRKNGLIPESMLPFSDDLRNIDEYYSFKGADEAACRSEGQRWLERFDFGHEWVFTGGTGKADKMMDALQYSPLGVSVQAWNKNGILFSKPKGGQDNHWTACVVGMMPKKYWIIDDSYLDDGQPLKYLEWGYDFGFCKRYSIIIKDRKKEEQNVILRALSKLLQLIGFVATHPNAQPVDKVIDSPAVQMVVPKVEVEEPQKYDWDTPILARHSVRVICDEEGLSKEQKDTMCATIGAESGWKTDAKLENKRNGKTWSTDWGICQWNDYYHGKEISPDEAVHNPEKAVRLMCAYWKRGQRDLWIGYKSGNYKRYL